MSYQVLARKYRPKSFDTLVGQEHVVRALTHALEQKRLHHAWLFTGTRGVGKTTLSRILAKALNCQGPDGNGDITAQPCGVCEACVAIDAGRFVDYIEMDAASNRGVDEMAQLLEQAVYAPSNARFKVYMIDEVHMLTNHAFNSMLKTLEEPPEHVKFILATTDPQKIPVTVLSRCLQFNLKQMPPGHIVGHLENILAAETIGFDVPALRLLAQAAHGSMRDALSLTDQAIAYAAGKVTLDAVQGMLGALDQSYLIRLLDALSASDGAAMLAVADELAARSLSWHAALQDLGSLLHQIALAQTVPAALPEELPAREDVLRLAAAFDAEEVQLYYQIVVHGRNELGLAPDEYAGFTMTLLRMLAFRPNDGADSAAGGTAVKPAMKPTIKPSVAEPLATPSNVAQPAVVKAVAPTPMPTPSAPEPVEPRVPAREPTSSAVPTAAPTIAQATAPARSASISPSRAALEAARNLGRGGSAASANSSKTTPAAASANVSTPAPTAAARPAPSTLAPWEDAEEAPPAWFDASAPDAAGDNTPAQKKTELTSSLAPRSDVTPTPTPTRPETASVATPERREDAPASVTDSTPATPTASAQVPAPSAPDGSWNGDWPALAAALPVRGVAQQLAQQSELVGSNFSGPAIQMHLKVPLDTLRSAGSVDKLTTALTEHFGRAVHLEIDIGPVRDTAHARAQADRAARQEEAEQKIQDDPFVQTLMREFGAIIVPGSIKTI